MKFNREVETFIKEFVKHLAEKNVAIFAGAGLSKAAGFVSWPELLRDIASELGLNVDKEHDLISLAQYHVNENGGKSRISQKILEEFAEEAEETNNHRILANLPITTYWTTNYDTLIENSLKTVNKITDVKHQIKQLSNTRLKRDVVVYKMHGDVHHASDAIITKEQYESYYKTHEPFVATLSGDLISKTFLFIGFSFTDPNLDYVLSRLNIQFGEDSRQHYCFIKKRNKLRDEDEDIYKYNVRKQELMIGDLKRYRIKAILVDEYEDITKILAEIESRYKKQTIFISGSAEEYGQWSRKEAQGFIHNLSKGIIIAGFKIVNGFGWGVGSAVINGALEAIYEKPDKYSEDQLILKPFPQFETGEKSLPELWEEYRQKMISMAGIAIFVFGNKKDTNGNIIFANGVMREFQISISKGLIPIPISATGFVAEDLFKDIQTHLEKYYEGIEWIIPLIMELNSGSLTSEEIVNNVSKIIMKINNYYG